MKWRIIVLTLLPLTAPAQQSALEPEEALEQIAILQGDDDVSEEQFEHLTHLLTHPIDLNNATADELRFLSILSEEQINSLIAHRTRFGDFISILELQSLASLDQEHIKRLVPYVRVRDPSTEISKSLITRIRNESDTYVLLRYELSLEDRVGFSNEAKENEKFAGGQGKRYLRFRSSKPGDFSFGITAENDPGETFTWKPAKKTFGADYLSFHAQMINKGVIKNLIVGDYQAQFGQGLVWGGISAGGKGAEIASVRRCNVGFVPYTSAYESGNLRGAATTLSFHKSLRLHGAYSSLFRDASITENGDVSSLQYSGLHRNTSELQKRKTVKEQVAGAALQFTQGAFDGGITFQGVNYAKRIDPLKRLYSHYSFRGFSNTNIGLYGNYSVRNFTVFTEAAHSIGGAPAFLVGTLFTPAPKMDLAIVHRQYAQAFQPFFNNAISENTKSQNEKGTYWGWKYRFNRRWSLSGYVDMFSFPGLKFRTYAPSRGHEWLLRINWQPSRSTLLYVQVREENKERNTDSPDLTYQILNARKYNYWLTADFGIGQKFRFRSRVLYSTYQGSSVTTRGFAFAQDLAIHLNRWKVSGRYALFDTDTWDNRLYLYEQDVWLSYSLPAYDGIGVRKIVVLEYKLNRTFSLWLRYAQTRYADRKEIGSGVDQILGDIRNDIKLQVRIRL